MIHSRQMITILSMPKCQRCVGDAKQNINQVIWFGTLQNYEGFFFVKNAFQN